MRVTDRNKEHIYMQRALYKTVFLIPPLWISNHYCLLPQCVCSRPLVTLAAKF